MRIVRCTVLVTACVAACSSVVHGQSLDASQVLAGRHRNRWQASVKTVAAVLFCLLAASTHVRAQTLPDFRVSRAVVPPKIDGDLSDAVWEGPALSLGGEWVSYNPVRGEKDAPRTEVRVAYDDRNLYLAFH